MPVLPVVRGWLPEWLMYARADEREGTYTVCTPVKPEDDPVGLGLRVGTLPGGWYLRGKLWLPIRE
ncbi:hypothetical protein ACPZ19_15910 [Amycolatopsis lurida]